jgi:hypothetical protein
MAMVPLLVAVLIRSGPPQTIVLGGDIMLNGILVKQRPLAKIAPMLCPASVAIANLEIPLTSAKLPTLNKSSADVKARNQFILKADPAHVAAIEAAGIDMVSLGNNHCMDYRAAGLKQMQAALAKHHVLFAGAGPDEAHALAPTIYTDRDGKRIGLISALAFVGSGALGHCTPAGATQSGIGTLSFGGLVGKDAKKALATMFAAAKARCDLLIVGLHWGIERQSVPTAYQVELGRACVDAGADIVWGNHPHVLEGAELYNGKPILYSMGNLISSKPGTTGIIKLVYDQGKLTARLFLPLSVGNGQVQPISGSAAKTAWKSFKALCTTLVKRYPSKKTKSLL